jgi:hypothetical protein
VVAAEGKAEEEAAVKNAKTKASAPKAMDGAQVLFEDTVAVLDADPELKKGALSEARDMAAKAGLKHEQAGAAHEEAKAAHAQETAAVAQGEENAAAPGCEDAHEAFLETAAPKEENVDDADLEAVSAATIKNATAVAQGEEDAAKAALADGKGASEVRLGNMDAKFTNATTAYAAVNPRTPVELRDRLLRGLVLNMDESKGNESGSESAASMLLSPILRLGDESIESSRLSLSPSTPRRQVELDFKEIVMRSRCGEEVVQEISDAFASSDCLAHQKLDVENIGQVLMHLPYLAATFLDDDALLVKFPRYKGGDARKLKACVMFRTFETILRGKGADYNAAQFEVADVVFNTFGFSNKTDRLQVRSEAVRASVGWVGVGLFWGVGVRVCAHVCVCVCVREFVCACTCVYAHKEKTAQEKGLVGKHS